MRLGQIGRKRNRAVEVCQRLIVLSERGACPTQQHLGACVPRIEGKGLPSAICALCEFALLAGQHSQVIVHIGVMRVGA